MPADRAAVRAACVEPSTIAARRAVCIDLSSALTHAGQLLWLSGYLIGGDRVSGASPFGNGNDAVVACAHVARTAAALCGGAVTVLDAGNAYSASALIRQLVEVDYLIWRFAAEPAAGAEWLRATHDDRRQSWTPQQVRSKSSEPFRDIDYWQHCEFGGHPNPAGAARLLDAEPYVVGATWLDLLVHSLHSWEGIVAAAASHGHIELHGEKQPDPANRLADEIAIWRGIEQVPQLFEEARRHEAGGTVTEARR